jgi:hypothetical protein
MIKWIRARGLSIENSFFACFKVGASRVPLLFSRVLLELLLSPDQNFKRLFLPPALEEADGRSDDYWEPGGPDIRARGVTI